MNPHDLDDADRRLLEDLLGGDRSDSDPDVRERFARSPALLQEWRELQGLSLGLQRAGMQRDDELAAAMAAVDDRDLAVARAAAERHLAQARRRRWWPLVVAAALVVVALGTTFWWRSSSTGDTRLGANRDAIAAGMSPHDSVRRSTFDGFHWNAPPPNGGYYRLSVYPAADERQTSFDPLITAEFVDGTAWQPDAAEAQRLLAIPAFCWVLTAVASNGKEAAPVRAFAHWSD